MKSSVNMKDPKLFLVPTPIGNLEDITLRAIRVLKEADLILAEDTRTSGKLLKHFEIDTPMMSYHMHNEHKVVDRIVERINQGEQIALISDAGTPGISDPGFLLVRASIENEIRVECLPGATASCGGCGGPRCRRKSTPADFPSRREGEGRSSSRPRGGPRVALRRRSPRESGECRKGQ